VKKVIAEKRYAADVPDQFYFSTPPHFGAEPPALGETVAVISDETGNLLALGKIEKQGAPYAECSTVKVTQRLA
jgi:hypothetical protein